MPSKTTTIIIMFAITGLLSLVNIFISARISHQGAKLQEIAIQKQALEKNIIETKSHITASTSLLDIKRQSRIIGLCAL
jgi:Na+-translocating ferredoxin:NAD+ oxidoreductase RnfG subunit